MNRPSPATDVTNLIRLIESGDDDSASDLWQLCFKRLQTYCRKKLPERLLRILDEEDVALSAFKSLCLGAQAGKFGRIEGRDELWKLLYCIAGRKAGVSIRRHHALKRGSGQVLGESAFLANASESSEKESGQGLSQLPDHPRAPLNVDDFLRDCEDLFEQLDTDDLRTIAMLRIEGYSVDEIAERLGTAKRTVERRLKLIRQIWESHFERTHD